MTRCTYWRRLPLSVAQEARRKAPSDSLDSAVQCQLSTHDGDEHYGLIDDLAEYGTALWLSWHGSAEVQLVALADCPVISPGPDGDGCCLYVGHPEQHTWADIVEEAR
ncbi:hypothetical protein [Streptomyces sp. NPDC052179]|uniref:hypothetical protein n=1 Tax=Streptomyces sp. NPDC052179 TaxID=3155680 RepID=UPI00341CF3E8